MSEQTPMQPRDRAEASRTVLLLVSVAAVVTFMSALLKPQQAGGELFAVVVVIPVVVLVVLAAVALTRSHAEARLAWAVFPFVTIVLIGLLDVMTADASTAAQVFFFFPVLYGAFNLPRLGAVLITAAAVAADFATVMTVEPWRVASTDFVYVSAALITSAAVLVYACERRADLVAILSQQAAIDPLTGLATRRVLDQAASSILHGTASGAGTALLLVDIDHFKSVNDHHGHIAGDEVLVALAEVLREYVRADSVVSRMGGDEIAVLLPGCALDAAIHRAHDICAAVRSHAFRVLDGSTTLGLTVSLGVAHAPSQADDLRSLYAAADAALYTAKRNGRDRAAALPVIEDDGDQDRRLRSVG